MKTEFLILVPDNESFCNTKKAFVDFLKIDGLITITGQKINYKRTIKGKEVISVKFWVDTDKVKNKQERYFLLALDCQEESSINEFAELCERIRNIAQRISPGQTTINTIWDDVGRIYAERSYPLVNEVENLMRKLITKFMLITVGMDWSKDAIHPDLFKKIEKFEEDEPYISDLYKLDFIHLKQVLFEKKRDISLEELDRLLSKTKFTDEDKDKILRYVPRSNWEKYFSTLIGEKNSSLETKWDLLYKLRNKVAHNRHVIKSEYEQIKGLSSQIKEIITKAIAKLGEIDLNEEDRELIIYSYQSDSPAAIGYLSEKAVAEHYMKNGYDVDSQPIKFRRSFDFLATKDGQRIGVEVKTFRPRNFIYMIRSFMQAQLSRLLLEAEGGAISKIHLVCVLREDETGFPITRIFPHAMRLTEELGELVDLSFGRLNEENIYVPLEP